MGNLKEKRYLGDMWYLGDMCLQSVYVVPRTRVYYLTRL